MLGVMDGFVLVWIVVIFLVSITSFGIMQLAPGSPVDILIGEAQVSQEQIDALWTLGFPVVRRYSGGFAKHAACGMLASIRAA